MKSFSLAEQTETIVAHLPSSPLVAALDSAQMEDALRRILSNAVKYGTDRSIDVRLELVGSALQISVADQGIGIAPENQGRIFKRFGRAEPTEHYGGLGLGLWIARNIVEGHGGELTVVSALGEGATFTVSIPNLACGIRTAHRAAQPLDESREPHRLGQAFEVGVR